VPEGFKKIITVAKKGDEIVIPFTKYQLDNGLTVILHPDNSDPLVHVVKSAFGQRDARNYETPRQKLNFLSEIISYNLDKGFVDKQNKILENVSLEELSGLAAKHLKLDEMITVVVGDKTAIMQSLQPMFENIVELDEEGKPL
jgi:zinc protease|tara:strand:- start:690 stop:1118 length:429 start_codon:yes stop_codon:yes gene_type:complete